MPRHDYIGECGLAFDIVLPFEEVKNVRKCQCGDKKCKAELYWLPMRSNVRNQQLSAVVYFKDKNGNIQFAGTSNDPTPKGMMRCEAYTLNELRRLETKLNNVELEKRRQFVEREQAHFAEVQSANRRELRGLMEQFSEKGKNFAREMMRRNDTRKGVLDKNVQPNVHLNILHYDGGRRRD